MRNDSDGIPVSSHVHNDCIQNSGIDNGRTAKGNQIICNNEAMPKACFNLARENYEAANRNFTFSRISLPVHSHMTAQIRTLTVVAI